MATSMEPEKYEVLETIGKDSECAAWMMSLEADFFSRSRFLWYYQESQTNIGWLCTLWAWRLGGPGGC